MAGGERGRLVEEKELRVISAPDVAAAVLEFADADEPVLVLPAAAAQRLIVAMQPPAAIAHHPAALSDGVQFAERIDAILQRPGSLRHGQASTGCVPREAGPRFKALASLGEETWRSNFGRIANIATGTSRPLRSRRASAAYECTFCADCVERRLSNVCPNCGGGFTPRPIRPAREWRPGLSLAKRPASTKRVGLSTSREEIAEFVREVAAMPPERR